MTDTGCILLSIFVIVIVPITGAMLAFTRSQKRTREEQQRVSEKQHERGERITQLIEAAGAGDVSTASQRELFDLMQRGPIGHGESVISSGGWFDRAAPVLRRMLRSGSGAKVVITYFECFPFPAGHQAKVLQFLHSVLMEAGEDRERLDVFQALADRILRQSTQTEAHWMYARTLDMVEAQRGTSASKALALHIGRISYSASRPDRTPTLYDEQAIANDIASRVASAD